MKAEFFEIQKFLKQKNHETLRKQITKEKQRIYEGYLRRIGIDIIKI